FGKLFRITTFGESHGKAVGVVIEGIKAGMKLDKEIIQKELNRRKPGQSKVSSSRKEKDELEILSGVFEGKTLGTPVCIIVRNKDMRPEDYSELKDVFRPGHAGFAFLKKFGLRDHRGGGRASARETIGRVAAGAIAKNELRKKGIEITAFTKEAAGIKAEKIDLKEIEKNPMKCPDKKKAKEMENAVLNAKKEGNSVGGIIELRINGVPAGIGEPVFSKLDAELAKALMGIGAVKGIEFGEGFNAAKMDGKENNDEMHSVKGKIEFKTNNAGGISGGISSGQEIVLRIAVKPTSSISLEQETVDLNGNNRKIKIKGRHDPCICPRIIPVAEAMAALVIYDLLLMQEMRKKSKLKFAFNAGNEKKELN
ncbi:MAG: chorismate synthase, partial [Candidatus Diapherotrites archaeon]